MILSELRDYIRERQSVPLSDIINHFNIDEVTARKMLDVWLNKGKIQKQMATTSCGSSCQKCNSANTEYYFWSGVASVEEFIKPADCPDH
jgi:putative ferrous iron transport protein C